MDFYERRWLHRVPQIWDILFSGHYKDRWLERSWKKWFKHKNLYWKIRYLINTWKVKIGKIVNNKQRYYVIDNKKRKHSFIVDEDKIIMITVYVPHWYSELVNVQKFINRLFLSLILFIK